MVHNGISVRIGRSTGLGFDLAWFSSPSSERLCIFCHHGAIYIKKVFFTSFPLPFGELSLVGFALDVSPSVL